MTRTATKTPARPRYVLGVHPSSEVLIPDGLSATPSEVATLATEAEKAYNAWQLASAQARAAHEEAKKAPLIDASADRAAVAAGTEMLTERLTPAAVEAATLAERRSVAAREHCREVTIEYATAVGKHRGAWRQELEATLVEQRREAHEILGNLVRILDQLQAEQQVLAGLNAWPVQGSLVGIRMRPGGRNAHQVAQAAREKARERIQKQVEQGGNLSTLVQRDLNSLVSALGVLIDLDADAKRPPTYVSSKGLK